MLQLGLGLGIRGSFGHVMRSNLRPGCHLGLRLGLQLAFGEEMTSPTPLETSVSSKRASFASISCFHATARMASYRVAAQFFFKTATTP